MCLLSMINLHIKGKKLKLVKKNVFNLQIMSLFLFKICIKKIVTQEGYTRI